MTKLYHEIRIDTAPATVWKALADLEAVQYYNPGVTRARYLSASREGVGASRECELKPKGRVKERVIAWEPERAISLELYEHEWPVTTLRWRTALQPDGTGTLVTQETEYKMKFGLFGALLNRLVMRRKLHDAIAEVFGGLKRFAEGGVAPASER